MTNIDDKERVKIDDPWGVDITVAEQTFHVVELFAELSSILEHSSNLILSETGIVINGELTLCIKRDMYVSQTTMVEQGGVCFLFVALFGLECHNDTPKFFLSASCR